ncbi:hypothetical protein Tco_1200330 [Tanacetum coccineum]
MKLSITDTFRGRVCECQVVQGVKFVGDGYKHCEASGALCCEVNNELTGGAFHCNKLWCNSTEHYLELPTLKESLSRMDIKEFGIQWMNVALGREQRGTSSIRHHSVGAKWMLIPRTDQHLKDFFKLVDSLDIDGSITTWEDLTTHFLAQFFPPGREPQKYAMIILDVQQHHGPSPQPQALETTFEARVRDYMAAHTERMEIFENATFKQREGINSKMTEMFGILKELTTSRTPEKEFIREEAKFPVTKNTKNEAENGARNKSIKTSENEEAVKVPDSQPVAYYLKHKINEKLIEGLVDNNRFNNSLSGTRVGKKKGKTYKVLPRGPIYDAILKKKITKKEDIG